MPEDRVGWGNWKRTSDNRRQPGEGDRRVLGPCRDSLDK